MVSLVNVTGAEVAPLAVATPLTVIVAVASCAVGITEILSTVDDTDMV